MKQINILDVIYYAEKIIKKDNNIKLINAINEDGISLGNIEFPNISNFVMNDEWDLLNEDEQTLYQLDLEFILSLLELGVNDNDLQIV